MLPLTMVRTPIKLSTYKKLVGLIGVLTAANRSCAGRMMYVCTQSGDAKQLYLVRRESTRLPDWELLPHINPLAQLDFPSYPIDLAAISPLASR